MRGHKGMHWQGPLRHWKILQELEQKLDFSNWAKKQKSKNLSCLSIQPFQQLVQRTVRKAGKDCAQRVWRGHLHTQYLQPSMENGIPQLGSASWAHAVMDSMSAINNSLIRIHQTYKILYCLAVKPSKDLNGQMPSELMRAWGLECPLPQC